MSLKNIRWARQQSIKPASMKHLLMTLASYANVEGCFECPTTEMICADTGLDRKTVFKYKARLAQTGLIRVMRFGKRAVIQVGGEQ